MSFRKVPAKEACREVFKSSQSLDNDHREMESHENRADTLFKHEQHGETSRTAEKKSEQGRNRC